ncbi:MAG: hypothetical protein MZU97_12895 [Bacillus subtilis]|nr:hypothetical protein [Bacillus subtilis]
MPASNVVITAQYAINNYAQEFRDHDGTVLQTGFFACAASLSSVTAPADPTRTGYATTPAGTEASRGSTPRGTT